MGYFPVRYNSRVVIRMGDKKKRTGFSGSETQAGH